MVITLCLITSNYDSFTTNKAIFGQTLEVPVITLNGTDLATTLSNCVKTNVAFTYKINFNYENLIISSWTFHKSSLSQGFSRWFFGKKKIYVFPLLIFQWNCLFFGCWVVWVLYILDINFLSNIWFANIFSCRLSSHFVDCLICCLEAFHLL